MKKKSDPSFLNLGLRKISLFIFSMMVIAGLQAQVVPSWINNFGAAGNDFGNDIAVDAAGNRYITGQYQNTVDFDPGPGMTPLTASAASDIFVVKLNSSGSLVWAKSFGGSGTDAGTSIAVDASQNVYFTGFGGSINFGGGLLTATGVDGYVCKLDASGNFVWAKALGGTGNQRGRGIATDGTNVYVAGEFTVSLSLFSFTAGQQNDAFTAKLSGTDGSTIWARQFQGAIGATVTGQQYGQGVTVDGSGNVITVGRFEGTVNFNPGGSAFNLTSNGSTDVFISKLDASGINVWAVQFGASMADDGYDVAVDGSGNVYTTGAFRDIVDFNPAAGMSNLTSAGAQDVFISKLNSAGAFAWANQLGGASSEIGQGITYNSTADEVGVTGLFAGTIDCYTTSAGNNDAFVSFYEGDGSHIITTGFGGSAAETGSGIGNDGTNYTVIGSYSSNPADFDPTAGNSGTANAGSNDIFIADYSVTPLSTCDLSITNVVSTNETAAGNNDGTITITASCSSCTSIQYSINGGMTYFASGSFTDLAPGMYQVQVRDSGDPCCTQSGGTETIDMGPTCAVTISEVAIVPELCPDANNGSITITASTTGAGPLTYSISGPVNQSNATGVFPNLPDGNYSITVSDNSVVGCMSTSSAIIAVQTGNALPGDWSNANVGNANGSASYEPCISNGQFTITASGFSTSSSDVLHLASRQLCGNGEIIAHVANVSGGGWAGVTLRESLAQGSKLVALKTQGTNNIRRMIRTTTNGGVSNLNLFRQHTWFRLVRNGSNFTGYTSPNGVTWTFAFSATVSMTGCIHAGLFAESINGNVVTTAVFDNVTVTGAITPLVMPHHPVVATAAPDFSAYPNPTTGEVNLDLSAYEGRAVRLELYDVNGKTLKMVEIDAAGMQERLNLSDLQHGLYLIRARAEGVPDATKRVVVQGKD